MLIFASMQALVPEGELHNEDIGRHFKEIAFRVLKHFKHRLRLLRARDSESFAALKLDRITVYEVIVRI